MRLDDPDNPLTIEIRQETANAYFAACKKMVDSLEALRLFDFSLPASAPDSVAMERRSKLLEEAIKRVHFVVIQREAMKLSPYEGFFQDYKVPEEVRAGLGGKCRISDSPRVDSRLNVTGGWGPSGFVNLTHDPGYRAQ